MRCLTHLSWLLGVIAGVCVAAGTARADYTPLTAIEVRAGSGVAVGGGAGISIWRVASVNLSLRGEYAFLAEPWTSAYGGLLIEAGRRVGYGFDAGVRVRPSGSRWRVAAGARAVVAPYGVYGPTFAVGACGGIAGSRTRLCADGEVAAFLWGGDLPDGRVAGQAVLGLGIQFDAW